MQRRRPAVDGDTVARLAVISKPAFKPGDRLRPLHLHVLHHGVVDGHRPGRVGLGDGRHRLDPGAPGPGQRFGPPDDAFVSPDGRSIVATQEENQTISVIDIATGRITRRYGHPGVPGSGPGYYYHPDDAMLLPGG